MSAFARYASALRAQEEQDQRERREAEAARLAERRARELLEENNNSVAQEQLSTYVKRFFPQAAEFTLRDFARRTTGTDWLWQVDYVDQDACEDGGEERQASMFVLVSLPTQGFVPLLEDPRSADHPTDWLALRKHDYVATAYQWAQWWEDSYDPAQDDS